MADTYDIRLNPKSNKKGFGRVRKTVIKKANGLHIWGADIYFVVRYHGRYLEYSSLNDPSWPPNHNQVVSATLTMIVLVRRSLNTVLGSQLSCTKYSVTVKVTLTRSCFYALNTEQGLQPLARLDEASLLAACSLVAALEESCSLMRTALFSKTIVLDDDFP